MTTDSKERRVWQRRARHSFVTQRGASWYEAVFDVSPDERVLDLGSGGSAYAPPNVIRLDYLYARASPSSGRGRNAAAVFQELPFADESFDRVVASWSFVKMKEGTARGVSEALRVLRPGGELQIVPVGVRAGLKDSELQKRDLVQYEVLKRDTLTAVLGGLTCGIWSLGATVLAARAAIGADAAAFLGYGLTAAVMGGVTRAATLPDVLLTVERPEWLGDEDLRAIFVDELTVCSRIGRGLPSRKIPEENLAARLAALDALSASGQQEMTPPFDWAQSPDFS